MKIQLPKLHTGVRFTSHAPLLCHFAQCGFDKIGTEHSHIVERSKFSRQTGAAVCCAEDLGVGHTPSQSHQLLSATLLIFYFGDEL